MATIVIAPIRGTPLLSDDAESPSYQYQVFFENITREINTLSTAPAVVVPPVGANTEIFNGLIATAGNVDVIYSTITTGRLVEYLISIYDPIGDRHQSFTLNGSYTSTGARRVMGFRQGDCLDVSPSVFESAGVFTLRLQNNEAVDLEISAIVRII